MIRLLYKYFFSFLLMHKIVRIIIVIANIMFVINVKLLLAIFVTFNINDIKRYVIIYFKYVFGCFIFFNIINIVTSASIFIILNCDIIPKIKAIDDGSKSSVYKFLISL